MNSTEVQNPRRKMHVLLLAEPKTPPGLHNTMGSPIVDGPEVPEDRDPAQREAEGPRSSMDYSEFPLLDFSPPKKRSIVS